MMRVGSVVRDLALVCVAVAVGLWWRGTPVQASGSSGSSPLAFQMTARGRMRC